MPTIPTPRSYNSTLSGMIDVFLSRFGITVLRPGNPILSILEAAAQSDVRATQDIFSFLNSINLDRAEGNALDRIGADEDLPRRNQTFSTGLVTISDTSFEKIVTKIYVTTPAPIVGTTTLYVADATDFTATGSVYLGRGTTNYEGPLTYTAKTDLGSYWSLTLSTPTQKFHNLQETVILAQGGNRAISAGSIPQTAQGNANQAVQFSTLYSTVIPDGETSITGVSVVAKLSGLVGNVPVGAIVSFVSDPFTGASVTNPLPISNARAREDDKTYRERIREARQTRAKGTALAIDSGVLGIVALDENKTVLSANVVNREGFPTTLYIDDGTGYEEQTAGVSIEGIVDNATGGEQYFEVNNRPIAKAFIETAIVEPYVLVAGSQLAIKVNGIIYTHTFDTDDFRNISSAAAYEVASSINSNTEVPFNARLSGNGTKVSVISDTDTQEDLEVWPVDLPNFDANDNLGFTIGRVDTMLLYRNDRLLSKDGRTPSLTSLSQSQWASALTIPTTLEIEIDNTGGATYSFSDQDFIDLQTGYTTMSSTNSLDSWVTVFNSKIVGVTAVKSGSTIILISNLGPDSRAQVNITGGSMIADGMFIVEESNGANLDYTLDRNTGQIRLEESLDENDLLSTGTANTRAFVESDTIPTFNFLSTAISWWVVDGTATLVPNGIAAGTQLALADYVPSGGSAWGDRVRITPTDADATPFTHVVAGDWAIFNDSIFAANNMGGFRVAFVDPGGHYFDIERPAAGYTAATYVLATGGLKFVHTTGRLQKVSIPAENDITADRLATLINARLTGATAYTFRTTKLRVRTNTFGIQGDIALVAQDVESEKMLLDVGDFIPNLTSHLGAVESATTEAGTPEFVVNTITSVTDTDTFVSTLSSSTKAGHILVFEKPLPDTDNIVSLNYTDKVVAGWTVAETVTGAVSGTVGTISVILGGAPGGESGTIVLTGVTGQYYDNEALTGSTAGANAAFAAEYTNKNKGRQANVDFHTAIDSISGTTVNTRLTVLQEYLPTERFYAANPYAIGPVDDFTVVVDEDEQIQRFAMPMFRRGKPTSATYAQASSIEDNDNGGASLALAFGTGYDFVDYAVWMKARVKSHAEGIVDTTKTILWRYYRHGPEGELANISYIYPTAASSVIGVTTDFTTNATSKIFVTLPSGTARTGVTVRNTTKIGVISDSTDPDTLTYILGYSIPSAVRVTKLKTKLGAGTEANFTGGEVLTGGTSGATATVSAIQYTSTVGRGWLTITGIVGTFVDGEVITGSVAGLSTVDGSQYGVTTLVLNVALPGAIDHGFFGPTLPITNGGTPIIAGDLILGATSNAMARVVTASPTALTLVDVAGVFSSGETIAFGGNSAVVTGPIVNGDTLYVNSTNVNFSSGLKNIERFNATDITYIEGTTAQTLLANIGNISYDIGEATLTGSTVISGDLANVSTLAGLPALYETTVKISILGAQYWGGLVNDNSSGGVGVTLWYPLTQSSYLSFFPIAASNTASAVATAVNALAAVSNSTVPVTAVAVGSAGVATGLITTASFEEFATVGYAYTFADGLNWVRSTNTPANTGVDFIFTFKQAITAALVGNSDWLAEDLRITPVTAKNVAGWFNSTAVSGLSSVAESAVSDQGDNNQISTLLAGRIGSVQVQGGSANAVAVPVVGSASLNATFPAIQIRTSDSVGLRGGQWVELQNTVVVPKNVFTATSVIASVTAAGVVTMDATSTTDAWEYANTAATAIDGFVWQIEKQGNFTSFVWDGIGAAPVLTGIEEGDWVTITGVQEGATPVNSRNQGVFRIVRANATTFWIENDNTLEERVGANLLFTTYNSIMPGDTFSVNSTLLGADNQQVWTVASIDTSDVTKFTVDISENVPAVFTGPITLGTSYPLFQVIESEPSKVIKKIKSIMVDGTDGLFTNIKFEADSGLSYRQIGSMAGTVVNGLDKLLFPTSLVQGVDGYRYSTGLIREANKVGYGDPSDPATYPGIIAAGAQINIEGPLVKRVTCSLALRLKSGVSSNDVIVRVRSAVASVINNSGVGESIAISDIVTAAGSVSGVVAVSVIDPTFTTGNDLIAVASFEKALVIDLTQDISVSLISE